MGETSRKLLEKLPLEKCWAITAKTLWRFIVLRGDKLIAPLLGIGKDIISPLWSKEKWYEINEKIFAYGGRMFYPWVKETFNIAVEDAIGALKLAIVAGKLTVGPEREDTIVEAIPERSIRRSNGCAWWVRHKESGLAPELSSCPRACQIFFEEGLKAVNAEITVKLTKSTLWGDPCCEWFFEFKEE